MGRQDEGPGCANHLHLRPEGGNGPEPSNVCSCPAGLVHMDDCPVTLGLSCYHFAGLEGAPAREIDLPAHEELHQRLMEDFLTRPYFHRVRSLLPASDAWEHRRLELRQAYAALDPEPDEAPDEFGESFLAERERLLGIRRKREEARRAREEQERLEKQKRMREQAARLVKQAEARAARESPPPRRRGRRRRTGPEPAPEARRPPESKPRRRRRRRRGRGRKPGGDAPA